MSVYTCPFEHDKEPSYNAIGSHDVFMVFQDESYDKVIYKLSAILCHLVFDHCCSLPIDFINNVMSSSLLSISKHEPKIEQAVDIQLVGYFSGAIVTGTYPEGFFEKLYTYMKIVNLYP